MVKFSILYFVRVSSFAAFILTATSVVAANSDSRKSACGFSKFESKLVIAEITNQDIKNGILEFPKSYLFSVPFRSGEVRRGLLLRANVYDFAPYTERDQYFDDGTSKVSVGVRDSIIILISSMVPLEEMLGRFLVSSYEGVPHKQFDIDSESANFGLLKPSKIYEEKPRMSNILYNVVNGKLLDVIRCNKIGDVPYPGCAHIFEVNNFDVEISYGLEELRKWRDLRANTEKLIDCFTLKAGVQLPEIQ